MCLKKGGIVSAGVGGGHTGDPARGRAVAPSPSARLLLEQLCDEGGNQWCEEDLRGENPLFLGHWLQAGWSSGTCVHQGANSQLYQAVGGWSSARCSGEAGFWSGFKGKSCSLLRGEFRFLPSLSWDLLEYVRLFELILGTCQIPIQVFQPRGEQELKITQVWKRLYGSWSGWAGPWWGEGVFMALALNHLSLLSVIPEESPIPAPEECRDAGRGLGCIPAVWHICSSDGAPV